MVRLTEAKPVANPASNGTGLCAPVDSSRDLSVFGGAESGMACAALRNQVNEQSAEAEHDDRRRTGQGSKDGPCSQATIARAAGGTVDDAAQQDRPDRHHAR